MSTVYAIANQKGGVGKTTTSVNLAASLAKLQQRVLLIDLDPQGNATMGSGVDKHHVGATMTSVLLDDVSADSAVVDTSAGYQLLPANRDLTAAEIGLLEKTDREYQIKQTLSGLAADYDAIIIDCPPSLNMLTVNALVFANAVLIPMQCEYFAFEGLIGLLETIEQIKNTVNDALQIAGVLLTMVDARNRLTGEVVRQLEQEFGSILLKTKIPRNIRLAEAPSHGLPVLQYDKASLGASAYLNLAKELLTRAADVPNNNKHEQYEDSYAD